MDSQKQVEPVGEPVLDRSRVPHHVAIIMDGNGRWAQSATSRGWPATNRECRRSKR